tara:strand:+ start:2048 stop:3088 length:1041 start_codon:yes stop_codon:yes gene_type:complete
MAETYADKGLTGLVNMGNTCFINTCIQMLSHTYELNDFLNKKTYSAHLNDNMDAKLLSEWDELRCLMWSQNCIIEPGKFIQCIHSVAEEKDRDIFSSYSQEDVSEFLLFIVDCFHTGISRPVTMSVQGNVKNNTDKLAIKVYDMIKNNYSKEYSEIWNIFYGTHVSEIYSLKKKNKIISQIPEPFFTISLSIPPNNVYPSIYDCFDNHVKGEILSGDNGRLNEETGEKEDVVKRITYWGFPTVLCIDLKRFDITGRKKQIPVNFPLEKLDLRKYVCGYNKESYIYDLYGVCNHSGVSNGGHYTGYVKNANGHWYEFNDTKVTRIEDTSKIVSPKAYCLFYRKKTTV